MCDSTIHAVGKSSMQQYYGALDFCPGKEKATPVRSEWLWVTTRSLGWKRRLKPPYPKFPLYTVPDDISKGLL